MRLGVTRKREGHEGVGDCCVRDGLGRCGESIRASAEFDTDAEPQIGRILSSDISTKLSALDLPDPALQQAYDWARISTVQGVVNNPYLGTGLVAGYRTSGVGQRPGFAWFFGRDSEWTSFALNAEGDFATRPRRT